MSDGLKANHRAAIIATLAANHRVEQAVLFGSRAMGTNTVASDVDIALFGQQLTLTDQANLAAACGELPMAQSVDLVLHSTIDNPALVEHIRSHGVEWYRRGGGSGSSEVGRAGLGYAVLACSEDDGEPCPGSNTKRRNGLFDCPPDEWEVTTLGKICQQGGGSIQTGPFGSQLHASDYVPIGIPSIMPANIREGRISDVGIAKITQEDAQRLSKYLVEKDDIIYSRRGDVEKCALIRNAEEGWLCGTGCLRVRPGKGSIDPAFCSYFLAHPETREWIRRHAIGATMPNLNTQILAAVPMLLPKNSEQKAIAHVLGTLDDKIELNRQMNETLKAMGKALFKSWFVDFDPVRAKAEGRSTGLPDEISALFPDSFEDSELGEIPRGWRVKRIEEYLELAYGKSLPAKSRKPGSVPVYGSGGVVGSHDVALTQGPTVIVGRKGTVGSLYLEDKPAFPIDTVFHILPRIGSMLFCYHLLACQPLSDMNTDAAVPGLNRGNVYRLEFPCPTSNLISAFDGIVGSFWKRQIASLDESVALARVRDFLLPKLIGGGLRVKGSKDFMGVSI